MFAWMLVVVCVLVCMYVCLPRYHGMQYVCMYVCMHACMFACMYACMYVYICTRYADDVISFFGVCRWWFSKQFIYFWCHTRFDILLESVTNSNLKELSVCHRFCLSRFLYSSICLLVYPSQWSVSLQLETTSVTTNTCSYIQWYCSIMATQQNNVLSAASIHDARHNGKRTHIKIWCSKKMRERPWKWIPKRTDTRAVVWSIRHIRRQRCLVSLGAYFLPCLSACCPYAKDRSCEEDVVGHVYQYTVQDKRLRLAHCHLISAWQEPAYVLP